MHTLLLELQRSKEAVTCGAEVLRTLSRTTDPYLNRVFVEMINVGRLSDPTLFYDSK